MTTPAVSEYAAAVRAALADIPPADRAELVEDLEDHLAEIADESGESLESRLGPPEQYAAELRAAYSDSPAGRSRLSIGQRMRGMEKGWADRVAGFSARSPRHASFVEFLIELRPAWWIVRGYLSAFLIWSVFMDAHPLPTGIGELFLAAAGVVLSVWAGRRRRAGLLPRKFAFLRLAFTAGAVLGGLMFLAAVENGHSDSYTFSGPYAEPYGPEASRMVSANGEPVVNIFPYTKDGKPLTDVLLYDQTGAPLAIDHTQLGYALLGTNPQPGNSFPKSLCSPDPGRAEAEGVTTAGPFVVPVCPGQYYDGSGVQGPVAPAPVFPTEPAASPTPSPTKSPSASPSPSPSKTP